MTTVQQKQAGPDEPSVAAQSSPKRRGWLRLALVAVVAAVVGAFAAANWRDRPFSLVFIVADIKAGIIILASVALGFILGVVFLWSVLSGHSCSSGNVQEREV